MPKGRLLQSRLLRIKRRHWIMDRKEVGRLVSVCYVLVGLSIPISEELRERFMQHFTKWSGGKGPLRVLGI